MRHLKRFNESLDKVFKDELQEFCEMNLAYLLDEGSEVRIDENQRGYVIRIKFEQAKSWTEIKDHIIPFATRLNNKYEIDRQVAPLNYAEADVVIYFWLARRSIGAVRIIKKIEDIIDDNLKIPEALTKLSLDKPQISDMNIYITGYKQEKKSILTKIKSFFK
jgi:hypothetical protein